MRVLSAILTILVASACTPESSDPVQTEVASPQQNVDWSSPETWIDEKLQGEHRDLAHAIWKGTTYQLNPRHLGGAWLLVTGHDLLSDDGRETLEITDRGRDFIEQPNGQVV